MRRLHFLLFNMIAQIKSNHRREIIADFKTITIATTEEAK